MILSSHLRLQEIWFLTKKRFKNQKSEETLRFGTLSFCPGYWKVSWRPTSYPTAPGWHIIKGGIQKVWGDNVTAGNSTEKNLFGKPKRTHLPKTSILSWPRKNSVATSSLKRIQEGIIPSMWGWQILVKHQTYFITTYLFHGVLSLRSSRCVSPKKITHYLMVFREIRLFFWRFHSWTWGQPNQRFQSGILERVLPCVWLGFTSQCLDTPDPSEVPKNKRYETTSSR